MDTVLEAFFSEGVDADDPSRAFTLQRNGSAVAGTTTFAGTKASFVPAAPLEYQATYTATLSTDIHDPSGNNLASSYTWSFTTSRCTTLPAGRQLELSSAVPRGGFRALATDGKSVFVWVADFGSTSGTLLEIAPADGQILRTESIPLVAMSPDSPANGIQFVADITWHAGALWASGVYVAPGGSFPQGIFRIGRTTGLAEEQIPASSPSAGELVILQGLASDGANLYAAIDVSRPGGSADHSIVRFAQASATEVPLAPALRATQGQATRLDHGGGALWVFANPEVQKVDPSTGALLGNYCLGEHDSGGNVVYLDHALWTLKDQVLAAYSLP